MKKYFGLCVLFLVAVTSTLHSQPIPQYDGDGRNIDTASSFIIIGDTQLRGKEELLLLRENNRRFVKALFKKIADERPGFVMILGDLTFDGGKEQLWQNFDQLAQPVHQMGIPVYPLLGNHEYFGNIREMQRQYFTRFKQIDAQDWYSFRWRDVGIIMLNSNFSELKADEAKQQERWYRGAIKHFEEDSTITSVIVACHHPPHTNSAVVSDDQNVQRAFETPFAQSKKTVLFITGHCHSYERFFIGGKNIIVSGGGGPRQALLQPPSGSRNKDYFTAGAIRPHHFCKISKRGNELLLEMNAISEDCKHWSIADTVVLRTQ